MSTHELPQIVNVPAQPDAHLLWEQTIELPHGMLQPPQFFPSEVVSVQVPEQTVWPVAQPHVPF